MQTQTANENLIGFLKENPNSTKQMIINGTGLNGLFLFNLLKKLQKEEIIVSQGDGDATTYSLVGSTDRAEKEQQQETQSENGPSETDAEEPESNDEAQEDKKTEAVSAKAKKHKGRDNSKLKFKGELFGKGPLVRTVVARYVKDNPTVTYEQLKTVFPDALLKRFGIFQDEKTAKDIAPKGERYFFKEEHVIKLTDISVVVCNQFTYDNIQPFLKIARKLGYVVE